MTNLFQRLRRHLVAMTTGEHGATAVEYALMLTVMFAFVFGAVMVFGGKLNASFLRTANTIPG